MFKSIISFVGDKMIQETKDSNTKEHLTNSIIELSNGKLVQVNIKFIKNDL